MLDGKQQAAKALELIRALNQARFFGTVELKFNSGNIVQVIKHESLKLESDNGSQENQDFKSNAEVCNA